MLPLPPVNRGPSARHRAGRALARPARPTRSRGSPGSALERVLDLLPRLLEVGLGLVGLALGLEALLVGHIPPGFLGLALEVLRGVACLVIGTHAITTSWDRLPDDREAQTAAQRIGPGAGHGS